MPDGAEAILYNTKSTKDESKEFESIEGILNYMAGFRWKLNQFDFIHLNPISKPNNDDRISMFLIFERIKE